MKYRKKPVVIDAMELREDTLDEVLEFVGNSMTPAFIDRAGRIVIKTLEGEMRADIGDYVIRGVQGEFYPCKPDIFEATYEEATDD